MAVSFLVTVICVPYWIRRAKKAELVGRDMHKLDKRLVAEIGGVPVLIGFLAGAFTYIGMTTFVLNAPAENYKTFAMLTSSLIAAMIGLIDDILGWKIGLRQWQKPLLTVFAALPLVVVNAGSSEMGLPLLGSTELSYLYPFIIIPLGIIGATNGFNMIGGYNGLEAGLSVIILSTLALVAYFFGHGWLAVLAGTCVTAALAFLFYNRYPARVFPGNTFTYFVGALIAAIAIMGNAEKIAVLLFIPYIIELFLKARGLMQKESFAKLLPDGTLGLPYDKWYGVEHVAISFLQRLAGKATERRLVLVLLLCEAVLAVAALCFIYFRIGLF